ncbi:uncharacterized protein DUF1360 [Nocardioides sp. J9]|uniref:DUF1360 domain-containing protein n=1 Tax=Nocardioides sp. J9 TaxID=935844 RepID=UPI0011A3813D|nr:DUF1360 domain-containing protein [Nocardioides sp. J9]TWG96358.1 uncharacterized protein DUF1360 [Nocardioides sp. J9]
MSTRPHAATDLLVDGLATYRLMRLVRDDRVAEPLRSTVHERYGDVEDSKVAYLLQCPWCLSIWFGAGLALLRHRWPRAADLLSRTLALSAMTGLAAEHLDS